MVAMVSDGISAGRYNDHYGCYYSVYCGTVAAECTWIKVMVPAYQGAPGEEWGGSTMGKWLKGAHCT